MLGKALLLRLQAGAPLKSEPAEWGRLDQI